MEKIQNFSKTAVVGTFLFMFALAVWYRKRLNRPFPTVWEPAGKVTELYLYPLKSGRRIPMQSAEFTKVGPRQTQDEGKVYQMRDRELSVYDAKTGTFTTAGQQPKLLFVEVSVHDENYFAFNAPDMHTLFVKRYKGREGVKIIISLWDKERIEAVDCGEEAAEWISEFVLGKNFGLRLAIYNGLYRRNVETKTGYTLRKCFYNNLASNSVGMFSDTGCCDLINKNSVDDLNVRMKNTKVTVHNFRPNVVVESTPYAEDDWDWIKIGDVVFQLIKPCSRCTVTTINPETGVKNADGEPLMTLRKYHILEDPELRKIEKYGPIMGLDLGVRKPGIVHVGDEVFVTRNSSIKVLVK